MLLCQAIWVDPITSYISLLTSVKVMVQTIVDIVTAKEWDMKGFGSLSCCITACFPTNGANI